MSILTQLHELLGQGGTKVIRQPGTDPTSLLLETVEFDATTNVSVSLPATATANPVEAETALGRGIVSHAVLRQPLMVAFTGEVTDRPLDLLGQLKGLGGGGGLLSRRRDAAWTQLVKFRDDEEPLLVNIPSEGVFSDMVITNLQSDRDPSTGEAKTITMEFQQVQIVSSLFLPGQLDLAAEIAGGNGVVEMGEQAAWRGEGKDILAIAVAAS